MDNYNLNEEIWQPIKFMTIKENTYEISSYGRLRLCTSNKIYEPNHHSTNGYDYGLFMTAENMFRLYPIDLIVATIFIPIPKELIETIADGNKSFDVIHINSNNRDNNVNNLQWVEYKEEWRIIQHDNVEYGKYSISNIGRVKNNNKNKILACSTSEKGYKRINLPPIKPVSYRPTYAIHRLVATAFVTGYTPEKNQVNHIDGNKANNTPRNLEWMSNRENFDHAISTGLKKTSITENDADMISQELVKQNGDTMKVFDILHDKIELLTTDIINNIKYKGSWAYISDNYFDNNYFNTRKYSNKEDIHRICKSLVKHNGKVKEVINELKDEMSYLTKDVIGHIKFKQTWSDISDEYFVKDQFRTVLNIDEVEKICSLLVKYNGNITKVYDDIHDDIHFITTDTIRCIRRKKNFGNISDKFFTKDQFK